MASIINRPDGHRWIQFVDPSGRRQTLRLGKATAKGAAEICRRVELLLAARIGGTSLDRETAKWLGDVERILRKRLAAVGLVEKPADIEGGTRLAVFLDGYIAGRKDLKRSTLTVLGHTRRCLVNYFGAAKPLRDITPADADQWRIWLGTQANERDNDRDGLSENTIRRRCGIARQFFKAAFKRGLIVANPFAELPTKVRGNGARQQFVKRDEIQSVIDAAPDVEWRAIIALSRYGGLRVPSELLALRWADVDLPAGRMTIRASKTEHHEDGGIRVCPIFPELRPYLEAAREAAPPGSEYVICRYRDTNANLRTQLLRIIARAGLKPWPKLFHNMRSSRQTELLDKHPVKAVCDWLGNSEAIAMEHYAQVTTDHFQAAATQPTGPMPASVQNAGEAESEAAAKQNAKQQSAAIARMTTRATRDTPTEPGVLQIVSASCDALRRGRMGGRGLEPLTSTMSTWRSNQLS